MKKALQPLYDYAHAHGFQIGRTRNGHLRISKHGFPPVFTGSTPSDRRAVLNALARLKRVQRQSTGETQCH